METLFLVPVKGPATPKLEPVNSGEFHLENEAAPDDFDLVFVDEEEEALRRAAEGFGD
jgi:hypothetical protein